MGFNNTASRRIDLSFQTFHRVAEAIGVAVPPVGPVPAITPSPALSLTNQVKNSIATRKVAFLIGQGFNGDQVTALAAFLKASGAIPCFVAPHLGNITSAEGSRVKAQFTFFNSKSLQFDAVIVPGGQSVQKLGKNGNVLTFIAETYKHCKPIIALTEAVIILESFNFPGLRLAKSGMTWLWTRVSSQSLHTRLL